MKKPLYFTLILGAFAFSFWLMWHTLGYDSHTGSILVGGKYWSDFGGHLPQIRSFSKGLNWPLEYPLYPGEPIRYHFLFYALVGLLEKAGLRLDYALNLPSALGFFFLLLLIFALAKKVFCSTLTALLSVLFFLFNSSFSWLDYLKSQSFNLTAALKNLPHLTSFPSFAPWNESLIAAFWNLNIYTNQRHLGLSFALVLAVIYILYSSRPRLTYLVGFFQGLLLVLNQAAAAIAPVFIAWFFVFRPQVRTQIAISFFGALPWLIFSLLFTRTSPHVTYHPGFLQSAPLNFSSFTLYWLLNFGLHAIFIPLGFFLAPSKAKILFPPILLIFVISNIFQFSPDMINNHKFFNFVLLLGGMFTAHALTRLKTLLLFLPLLVLGGIVDFFPVKNDIKYSLLDYPKNPDVNYFIQNTPPDSVVLNSTWFYHPASLAGRKVFNGYPYFTWSHGYDQVARERQTAAIYQAPDQITACRLLSSAKISFVELSPFPERFITPNHELWKLQFTPDYKSPKTHIAIYSVQRICQEN